MTTFQKLQSAELTKARAQHPSPLHSLHEGWGVLMEEVDEFTAELRRGKASFSARLALAELVQVGAVVQRIAEDCLGVQSGDNRKHESGMNAPEIARAIYARAGAPEDWDLTLRFAKPGYPDVTLDWVFERGGLACFIGHAIDPTMATGPATSRLWDHMSETHGIHLTVSEENDIRQACKGE